METYIIITCTIALVLNAVNMARLARPSYTQLAIFMGGQLFGAALFYLILVTWMGWVAFAAFNVTTAVLLALFIMLGTNANAAQ